MVKDCRSCYHPISLSEYIENWHQYWSTNLSFLLNKKPTEITPFHGGHQQKDSRQMGIGVTPFQKWSIQKLLFPILHNVSSWLAFVVEIIYRTNSFLDIITKSLWKEYCNGDEGRLIVDIAGETVIDMLLPLRFAITNFNTSSERLLDTRDRKYRCMPFPGRNPLFQIPSGDSWCWSRSENYLERRREVR